MTRALPALLLLALTAGPLAAAPPAVEIPAEVVPAGDYAIVQPKTDAKAVTYVGLSGVEPFPSAMLSDRRAFVLPVRGLPAGTYRFAAVATLGDEQALVTFAVAVGPPPAPPGPPPPNPTPPAPTPPAPKSPLGQRLQQLFDADPPADRGARLEALAELVELYLQAAELAAHPDLASVVALLEQVRKAREALKKIRGLDGVRAAVAAEVGRVLAADGPLTDDLRRAARDVFAAVAAALKEVR